MEKGRTPPQQNISSCLLYYFHCFPTFRVTKKEKARREKESPSSQHSVAIHSSAGKELNGTGICQSLDRWVLLSPVSCFSPSTYGPCSSQQAFSHLKVTVHDPTGTQCSQPPLFSKGNSWNPCWEFTGLGQVKGGWKYRWKASECLIAPFLKRKACLMFTQKESEPSPSYSSSELIPMDLEVGKCLWYFIYIMIFYTYIYTSTREWTHQRFLINCPCTAISFYNNLPRPQAQRSQTHCLISRSSSDHTSLQREICSLAQLCMLRAQTHPFPSGGITLRSRGISLQHDTAAHTYSCLGSAPDQRDCTASFLLKKAGVRHLNTFQKPGPMLLFCFKLRNVSPDKINIISVLMGYSKRVLLMVIALDWLINYIFICQ